MLQDDISKLSRVFEVPIEHSLGTKTISEVADFLQLLEVKCEMVFCSSLKAKKTLTDFVSWRKRDKADRNSSSVPDAALGVAWPNRDPSTPT